MGVWLSWLEHLPCKQGVIGSNPIISTIKHEKVVFFRNKKRRECVFFYLSGLTLYEPRQTQTRSYSHQINPKPMKWSKNLHKNTFVLWQQSLSNPKGKKHKRKRITLKPLLFEDPDFVDFLAIEMSSYAYKIAKNNKSCK